jgi:hypothetical protein
MALPRSLLLLAVLALPVLAAEPAFVGRQACAACHPAQAEAQAGSAHAAALSRPEDHRLAAKFPTTQTLVRPPGFRYRYIQDGAKLEAEASFGDMARRTVVDWAFGAGDQAVTFVSQTDDRWYVEHYWTFYSSIGGYGPTPGHQLTQADDLGQSLGVMYRTFSPETEILRCFRCHTTGPIELGENLAIEPSELGVQCEACHGPGGVHAARAAAGGFSDSGILNPGKLEPNALLEACGQCHRPPAQQPSEIDYRDPWNVRHQPLYLVRSACYQQSGALTCMSCHDPHAPLVRHDSAYYDARCKSCHSAQGACKAGQTAQCASCHMPAVEPQEGLRFTNHWIGVFPPGESYLPRR